MQKKKVLVIVAHPDDETIWMGGSLLRNSVDKRIWNTTIISLCRRDDLDRAPKFKKVCEFYNAKSFMSDLDDEILMPLNQSELTKRILEFADESYDLIYTHGLNGEYGHLRHIEVHKAVKFLVEKKKIITKKLFCFDYKKISMKNTDTGFDCVANKSRDKFIKLKSIELLRKKDLIQNFYGFSEKSFEVRSSRNIESYKEVKLK